MADPSADLHLLFTLSEEAGVNAAELHTPALNSPAESTSPVIADDLAMHNWIIDMDTVDEVDELDSSFAPTPVQSQQSPLPLSPSPLSSRVRKPLKRCTCVQQ
jgi:hypothetical protein